MDAERERKMETEAAGTLSQGIASELVRPLRDARERLAVLVERIDRYMSEAKGPTPYPWLELSDLREQLAEAYLATRTVSRLVSDFSIALSANSSGKELVDLNKLVESAVHLTRHHMRASTEVFLDEGTIPFVRVPQGAVVLAVARLLMVSAASAAGALKAAISIRTCLEPNASGSGEWAQLTIADNGVGDPKGAAEICDYVAHLAEGLGGHFDGTSESGSGSIFELKLPIDR